MGARGCDGTEGEPIPERSGKRQHCGQAVAGLVGDDRIQRIMILALAMRHSVERPAISMEGGKSLWSGLPPPSD